LSSAAAVFAPDLFLRYDSADVSRQIALLKNMGLNVIRLEGHLPPDDFFSRWTGPAS